MLESGGGLLHGPETATPQPPPPFSALYIPIRPIVKSPTGGVCRTHLDLAEPINGRRKLWAVMEAIVRTISWGEYSGDYWALRWAEYEMPHYHHGGTRGCYREQYNTARRNSNVPILENWFETLSELSHAVLFSAILSNYFTIPEDRRQPGCNILQHNTLFHASLSPECFLRRWNP